MKHPAGKTEGPLASQRWLIALLGAAVAVFALWAVFGTLAALHFRSRMASLKTDLADERQDSRGLRAEALEARSELEDRVREYDALRGKAGALLNLLCRNPEAPRDIRAVLDAMRSLGAPVYHASLTDEEINRALQRLRGLLEIKADAVIQPVEWIRGLEIVARAGFFALARVPEAADLVQRELYIRETARPAPPAPSPGSPSTSPPTPAPPPQAAETRKRIDSPGGRFSLSIAPDWSVRDSEAPQAVILQGPRLNEGLLDRGYAMVSGVQIRQDVLLDEYVRQRLDAMREDSPGLVVDKEGPIPIAGGAGRFALCRHPAGNATMKVLSVVTMHKGHAYWLHFRVREDLYPRLEREFLTILESFQPR